MALNAILPFVLLTNDDYNNVCDVLLLWPQAMAYEPLVTAGSLPTW
jgi:hypothetical protein